MKKSLISALALAFAFLLGTATMTYAAKHEGPMGGGEMKKEEKTDVKKDGSMKTETKSETKSTDGKTEEKTMKKKTTDKDKKKCKEGETLDKETKKCVAKVK